MTKFLGMLFNFALVSAAMLLATFLVSLGMGKVKVRASEGGFAVCWSCQDTQRALKEYVEKNCVADVWWQDVPTKDGNIHNTLRLHCEVGK